MARTSTAYDNACLAGGNALLAYHALNSADTSTTGANEISGGTYARVALTMATPSSASTASSGSLVTNVPASTTVAYFSEWSAITGGTFEIGGQLSSSQTFSTAGTFTIASAGLTIGAS